MLNYVNAKALAQMVGLTERRINQKAKENSVFARSSNGNFESISWIENYYREKLISDENILSLDREKALHEKAKRETAELKLALMQGKAYNEEDIELAIAPMILAFKNRILAIASTVAEKLVGLAAKDIETMLDKEHKQALRELSDYDQIKIGSSEYEVVSDGSEDPKISS